MEPLARKESAILISWQMLLARLRTVRLDARALRTCARQRDPHEVLGILPGSSEREVKQAFLSRTWQLHPDRHGTAAEDKFKEVTAAYRQLTGGDEVRAVWSFAGRKGRRQQQRTTPSQFQSCFREFMGVRPREREGSWSHMLRAALCDRLAPSCQRRAVDLRRRQREAYESSTAAFNSCFVEFMGVRRQLYEGSWSHVKRAVSLRLAPRHVGMRYA